MKGKRDWAKWKHQRTLYPMNWTTEIVPAMLQRAQYTCEATGCGARHRWIHPLTGSIVYLQVAHLDHVPGNVDPANLRVMCQRCHLRYDARLHVVMGYMTRRKERAIEFWPETLLRDGEAPRLESVQGKVPALLDPQNAKKKPVRLHNSTEVQLRKKRLVDRLVSNGTHRDSGENLLLF